MQEQSKSASERQAEVLEWMGTAYGRRRIANSDAQSNEVALPAISHANSSTASRSDRLAGDDDRPGGPSALAGGSGELRDEERGVDGAHA